MASKVKARIALAATEVDEGKSLVKVWNVVLDDDPKTVVGEVRDHYVPTPEGGEDGAYKGWKRSHLTAKVRGNDLDVTACTTRAQTVSKVRKAAA